MGDVLKRRKVTEVDGITLVDPKECAVFIRYPSLWTMLASRNYPDGGARQTSTLLFFVDQGCLKACLNDRDQGLQAWASGATVADLLDALERGLEEDTLDWRASGKRVGRKGK